MIDVKSPEYKRFCLLVSKLGQIDSLILEFAPQIYSTEEELEKLCESKGCEVEILKRLREETEKAYHALDGQR